MFLVALGLQASENDSAAPVLGCTSSKASLLAHLQQAGSLCMDPCSCKHWEDGQWVHWGDAKHTDLCASRLTLWR